ncbi:FtsX-like permease family protein [Zeaxanthinibacter sp. PT1]|uniref:ABC transporter permease n=1 Tax=Zeaxanthinibacter TaxID=561554 RepID=UPI00234B0BB4|nr:FtsX-like permease family protein [Zeaxanthinibacter sp. PT1]MDC6350674.1 FtsX-like permease family protein [Zeaxanthinibacter sp. PT1]
MNFPFYIAKRYVRSKSSQNAVNIINLITFLVIVIGSAALFIVLSGFAGLKSFSLSFSNTFDPDFKALPESGKFFSVSLEQEEALDQVNGLASYSKEIEERVYLNHQQKSHVAYIKGVDEHYNKATGIDSTLYLGSWNVQGQQAVAGIGIANLLGLSINNYQNPLVALAPKPGKGSLSQQSLNAKPYTEVSLVLTGIYAIEENLDKKYVFTDLNLVQALLEKSAAEVSGVNFNIADGANMEEVQSEVAEILGAGIILKDRRALNSTLYRMLNTENLATYLIFTLVLIIALFNVVGAIIMMILDKQQNTRTLYSLGATVRELRQVYFIQGVMVTSLGGFFGVGLGALLIGSQIAFGWLRITPSLAYPVEFQPINILIVLGTIVLLGIIASQIASSRVNKKLLQA